MEEPVERNTVDAPAPRAQSTGRYLAMIVLVLAGWGYLWVGGVLYTAESGCVGELQAMLLIFVAPGLQVASLVASAAVRTRRWHILGWGCAAALGLYLATYATTTTGLGC